MAFLSGLTGVFFSPYWIVKGWTNFFFQDILTRRKDYKLYKKEFYQ